MSSKVVFLAGEGGLDGERREGGDLFQTLIRSHHQGKGSYASVEKE